MCVCVYIDLIPISCKNQTEAPSSAFLGLFQLTKNLLLSRPHRDISSSSFQFSFFSRGNLPSPSEPRTGDITQMWSKTILISSVALVVLVVATENHGKSFHQQPIKRDQKTFQHIQSILRNNYERSLRQEHFRRRNSRFLAFDRPALRRPRKINSGNTKIQVEIERMAIS